MINSYLKQIIELDQGIRTERKNIQEEVEHMETETTEHIQGLEKTILEKTEQVCQNNYNKMLAQAEEIKKEEIKKAKEESQALRERYERVKSIAVDYVLKSLLEESNG